jgi:hypothetical protein
LALEVSNAFSGILIEIINLDDPGAIKPENVFAVPTYVLDGKIVSLGNPYRDQLVSKIRSQLLACCAEV